MTNRNQIVITHVWEQPVHNYMEKEKIYYVIFGEKNKEHIEVGIFI